MAGLADGEMAKYQALGNDYLVAAWTPAWGTPPAQGIAPGRVRRLCCRRRGVGADGLVVVAPLPAAHACVAYVAIHNADGGLAERSGNGLRIAAQALFDWGGARPPRARLLSAAGPVEIRCRRRRGGVAQLAARIGRPAFGAAAVGAEPDHLGPAVATAGGGRQLLGAAPAPAVDLVSVGNPHAVWWVGDLDARAFLGRAPALAAHAAFPRGINVQMATWRGPQEVAMLIWERGVGRTRASGTSACAVVASALRQGRVATPVRVLMPGGAVEVLGSLAGGLWIRGPVRRVFRVRPDV